MKHYKRALMRSLPKFPTHPTTRDKINLLVRNKGMTPGEAAAEIGLAPRQ